MKCVTKYGEKRKVRAMAIGMKSGVENIKGSELTTSAFQFHSSAELPSALRTTLPRKTDALVNSIGI